jgi:hypothetical protein
MALCPRCKEPVSQFAAGCAVCGADLEKHRREQAARRSSRRVALPGLPRISEAEVLLVLIGLLMVAYPIAGLALALLAAYRHPVLSFRGTRRTVLLALAGLGVVVLLATGGMGVFLY